MRYILNNEGYIYDVSFGAEIECDLGTCTLYNGEVPNDYKTIDEWFDKEIDRLNAWKIVDGNLVFDSAKEDELIKQYEKELEDHKPLCKNDLYEINERINQNDISTKEQHQTQTASGKLVEINNAFALSPNIKITNINTSSYNKFKLITTNKNMLPNTAVSKTISSVKFTQNSDRSITVEGTSSNDIEYDIAGTNNNISPIFAFKKGIDYFLSKCSVKQPVEGESLYFDNANGDNLKTLEIEGNSYQKTTTGKNLLYTPYTEDNKLTETATKDDHYSIINYYATLEAGKAYTFHCETDGTWGQIASSDTVEIFLLKDKKYDNIIQMRTNPYTFTPTVSGNYYIRYDVNKNGTTHSFWNFYVAEENSFSGYEEYTNGVSPNPDYPQEIEVIKDNVGIKVTGKNLFKPTLIADDGNTIIVVNADIVLNDDTFSLICKNGTDMYFGQVANKGTVYNGIRGNLIDVSNCSKISFSLSNNLFNNNYITYYDENKISLGFKQFNSSNGTYTISNGVKYVSFRFGLRATIGTSYQTKVQIEYDTPTDYEKYQEQITNIDLQGNFIGKIGDVKDRLYIQNGHAYLEKNIGKVVLNGINYNFPTKSGTTSNNMFITNGIPNIKKLTSNSSYGSIISTHFTNNVTNVMYSNDIVGIAGRTDNGLTIGFGLDSGINTIDLANEWLKSNNVEVFYELETQETIDLGEVSIPTYEGVNNISLIANMDTNMYGEYLEDLTLKMYNYDGIERNEIYNGVGGSIKFTDEDKPVTHVVLNVRKGITIDDIIYPQLELGTTNSDYETHKGFELDIDIGDLVDKTINYIQITNDIIKISIDNEEDEFGNGYLSVLSGYNLIYGTQDVDLDVTYYINELVVDDLGFLQGKATTTNKFKILEDGSIEAHDGYFSGEVVITGGSIKDATIDGYVQNDTLNNTLKNYVNNTTLDNTLNGYVENDTLNSYATKEALNTTNNNLATTNSNLETTNNNLKTTNKNLETTNTNLQNNYSSNNQLKTAGATIINGNNITTGSIKSNNYVSGTSGTKIDLSNGTIDSKNFKVKNDGSVDVTGDIYLGSGSKVVGGDGLLTNLHFQTIEKYSGYSLLGFAYNYGDTFDKLDVDLDVYIPTNFKVVEAYATLYHTPVDWAAVNGYSQSAVVGYCRNVELYKCTDNKNFTMQASMGGGYYITTNELDGDLINEAFGTDGYTATNKTAPTIEVTRSSNIGASLTTGNNKLFLRTSQDTSSYGNTDEGLLYSTDACSKTGLIKMVVDVIGYMNYE